MSRHGADSPSFLQRCRYWHNALEPRLLLASTAEIKNRRVDLEERGKDDGQEDKQVEEARKLVQVSVHPDTGSIIPMLFRPPAYVLTGAPLAVAVMMSHRGLTAAFLSQVVFQAYNTGFTVTNRNLSVLNSTSVSQHPLYLSGVTLYVACLGAAPLYVMKRLNLTSPAATNFYGRFVTPPVLALLGGLSVLMTRFSEVDNGIEVTDAAGNVVGVSQNAGIKAVKETALSRSVLFGVTALVPSLVRRSQHMLLNPKRFNVHRLLLAALTFMVTTPISFSLFPQHGKISRDNLENELKEKTADSELFYHRGI